MLTSKKDIHNELVTKEEKLLSKFLLERNPKLNDLLIEISDLFFESNSDHLKSITDEDLKKYILLVSPYRKFSRKNEEKNDHLNFLPQFANHCYSPPVSVCSCCGEEFITEEEKKKILDILRNIKDNKDNKKSLKKIKIVPNEVNEICSEAQKRRNLHFCKECGTDAEKLIPGKKGALVSYHQIVRTVLFKRKYVQCKQPSREMIEEMINYAKSKDEEKRGNIYNKDFAEKLLTVAVNLLYKRNSIRETTGKRMLENNFGKFLDRLIFEIRGKKEDLFIGKPATLEGVRKELIDKCLKSFEHCPQSKSQNVLPIEGITKLKKKVFYSKVIGKKKKKFVKIKIDEKKGVRIVKTDKKNRVKIIGNKRKRPKSISDSSSDSSEEDLSEQIGKRRKGKKQKKK